ncbi:hypothetical protein [Candidatus Mycolicibacterium alkanivorans]|uniref:Uncharacterized protein n=1 Tax=Candidatus Mycolicibacterium alkanivorans TaxID=2954114 RepID=A0ABS9YSU1_9MYCO|nr:hypothetical protein [Candidatus Mycolicibacterium alkanivorans]MCI4674293.1 hypothetical protein [Candidatus Mycolicibacterium alkanivorans]
MWITLYLITAVVVAFLTWHMSHHLQSFDGPTDEARAFWSIVAGAIWPIVLVGVAQMLVVHLITARLRRAPAAPVEPVPMATADVAAHY